MTSEKINKKNLSFLHIRLGGMIVVLSAQFILGMVVNLFSSPPDKFGHSTEPLWAEIAFFMHSILGLLVLIGAIVICILAMKLGEKRMIRISIFGLLSVFLAFIGGIMTVIFKEGNNAEIASLIMAIGFLVSFVNYGRLFFQIRLMT